MLVALLAIAALAWAYVLWLAAQMYAPSPDMAGMTAAQMAAMMAPGFTPWTATHALFMFAMWAVMMVGMMTPSVAPMVLMYTRVAQQANTLGIQFAPAGWFAAVTWWRGARSPRGDRGAVGAGTRRSADADDGQRQPGSAARCCSLQAYTNGRRSRTPVSPLPRAAVIRAAAWRLSAERRGSLRLGLLHGLYCVGCCWALMALLFVGGVMNLLWIAALMMLVLVEKILPARVISRLVGVLAAAGGIWLIWTA